MRAFYSSHSSNLVTKNQGFFRGGNNVTQSLMRLIPLGQCEDKIEHMKMTMFDMGLDMRLKSHHLKKIFSAISLQPRPC